MKSSFSRARALVLTSLAGAFACLFAACGQNPGQTGLDYLESQGVRIDAPLYHLSFDDLPLDTVFGSEVPLNHYGESLLVVGREGDYVAKARMAFQFSTQAQRDSLEKGLFLRLTAVPVNKVQDSTNNFAGRNYLRESVQNRDSLRVLVESFSFVDSAGISFDDTLVKYHRRLLGTLIPFSTLDHVRLTRDTVTIYPKRAYPDSGIAQDSSQFDSLPNLRARLLASTDTTKRLIVMMELSPLTTSDSGMFRFIGQAATTDETTLRRYNAGLWSGRHVPDSLATVGAQVRPYYSYISSSSIKPSTNYQIRHTGLSSNSLLHGVSRGMHLRINRDTLINRIRIKLNQITPGLGDDYLGTNATGDFDRRFFVPYAEMRLPIDTAKTRMPGSFAIDMAVVTDVDSLGLDTATFRDDISLASGNDSLVLTVHGGPSTAKTDNLIVKYRPDPADTTLRQVITRWAGAPTVADTFVTVPDGRHRELTLTRRTNWTRAAVLSIKPSASQLRVEVFFNVGSITEPRQILDSAGNELTAARQLTRRYYRPGADSLNVRVTRGLRSILNRNYVSGTGIAPDMFLRSVDRAVFDTTDVRAATYRRIEYPVTGELDFKRSGGRLVVGLELYLYPLETGR